MRKTALSAIIFLLFNFQFTISAQVASEGEMLAPGKVGTDDMIAVFADDVSEGDYEIAVESSSSMFRIAQSILHVKDGSMSATLTMGGKGYAKLFLGTAQEASDANGEGDILRCPPTDVQEISQNADAVVFEIPVSALNTPIKCAAYSVKKKKWYDRDILFDASSLPSEKLLVYPKKSAGDRKSVV